MHASSRKFIPFMALRWVVALALVVSASVARAQGLYEVFAEYKPKAGGDVVRMPLSAGVPIPNWGVAHDLDQIVIQFKSDKGATDVMSLFESVGFSVEVGGTPQVVNDVKVADLSTKNNTVQLYKWDNMLDGAVIKIGVGVKLTPKTAGAAALNVGNKLEFHVVKAVGNWLTLQEFGEPIQKKPKNRIDIESQVRVVLNPDVCSLSSALAKAPWTYLLTSANNEGKAVETEITPDTANACEWVIPANWKEFVDKEVSFKVQYRSPNATPITVVNENFKVYNLGLITTLPVVSEIISAADGSAFRDIEAISKVSINLAVPVGGGRDTRSTRLALVFPWTLSVNTRDFPDLAKYVALAPSISILGGGSKEDRRTSIGLGIGVNLMRVFHFSYTVSTTGEQGGYMLVGVSVPELLPVLRNFWGGAL